MVGILGNSEEALFTSKRKGKEVEKTRMRRGGKSKKKIHTLENPKLIRRNVVMPILIMECRDILQEIVDTRKGW